MPSKTDEIPDQLTITLRKPVSLGEIQYDRITLQEPTAAQLTTWDRLEGAEADIAAVSIVSGVPKPAIEKIGARDLNQAARYIASFLA